MFKKPVSYAGNHKLSGKDLKRLKKELAAKLPSADDAALELLLPSKGDLSVAKMGAPFKGVVYFNGEQPMVIDVNGKGDFLVPTVMALWSAPQLLPTFTVRHPQVTKFIVGGAHLMLPGVRPPSGGFAPFAKGDVFAVLSPGNPMPIAVGTTLMDSTAAASGKGKLLELCHTYGDMLWAAAGRAVPNEGFLADGVVGLGCSMDDDMAVYDAAAADDAEPTLSVTCNEPPASEGGEAEGEAATADVTAAATTSMDDQLAARAEHVMQLDGEAEGAEEEVAELEDGKDKTLVDAALDAALLQALHTTVKDKLLPLSQGQLWNAHVLPARTAGSHLDVRQSSYKKLGDFLKAKVKEGLLDTQVDKKTKEAKLVRVNRSHPAYCQYVPSHSTAAAAEAAAAGEEKTKEQLEVISVFKPSHDQLPLFEAMGGTKGNLYTLQEVEAVLRGYCEKEALAGAADTEVTLDPCLSDVLFKGLLKRGDLWPTRLPKTELTAALIKRLAPHHVVLRGKEQLVGKGAPAAVEVVTEKRQGSKKVTRVLGLEALLLSPAAVAGDLQRTFAGSASVQELPGKKVLHEVVVQGDHGVGVAEYLRRDCGLPASLVKQHNNCK